MFYSIYYSQSILYYILNSVLNPILLLFSILTSILFSILFSVLFSIAPTHRFYPMLSMLSILSMLKTLSKISMASTRSATSKPSILSMVSMLIDTTLFAECDRASAPTRVRPPPRPRADRTATGRHGHKSIGMWLRRVEVEVVHPTPPARACHHI